MKILELFNVSKNFNNKTVLSNIDLNLISGEIVGIVAPNGEGKTTLFKIISNLISKTSGEIKCSSNTSGIISTPGLYPFLTGREHLEYIHNINNNNNNNIIIEDLISFIGIGVAIDKKVKTYSLGMKQRLALAISLLSSNSLLILDEPFNGIDIASRNLLIKKIKSLREKENKTILISSHLLEDIQHLCDRVIFIKNGSIVETIDLKTESTYEKYEFKLKHQLKESLFLNQLNYINNFTIENKILTISIKKTDIYKLLSDLISKEIEFESININKNIILNQYNKLYSQES